MYLLDTICFGINGYNKSICNVTINLSIDIDFFALTNYGLYYYLIKVGNMKHTKYDTYCHQL